jgi:hypothetical protein
MAGVAGLEPKKESSPIFAKMRKTPVFVGESSLFLIFSQFVFAKKNEDSLSLIVPKKRSRGIGRTQPLCASQ